MGFICIWIPIDIKANMIVKVIELQTMPLFKCIWMAIYIKTNKNFKIIELETQKKGFKVHLGMHTNQNQHNF
jgi:hypothetical protein